MGNFHYEEVEPIVHIKAVNVMSEGLDFLEMTETTYSPQQQIQSVADHNVVVDDEETFEQRNRFKLNVDDDDDTMMEQDDEEDDQPLFVDDEDEEQIKEELK